VAAGATTTLTTGTTIQRQCLQTTLDTLPGMRPPTPIPRIEASPIPLLLVAGRDHPSIVATNAGISLLLETSIRPTRRPSDRHFPNLSTTMYRLRQAMARKLLSV
jgi:hypothetical protein